MLYNCSLIDIIFHSLAGLSFDINLIENNIFNDNLDDEFDNDYELNNLKFYIIINLNKILFIY